MISRYTRPAMGAIWELENKFNIWKEIELLACEAQAELGQCGITKEDAKWIRDHANFTVDRVSEIEAVTNHDVIAFLTNMAEYIDADIPEGEEKPRRERRRDARPAQDDDEPREWTEGGVSGISLGDLINKD